MSRDRYSAATSMQSRDFRNDLGDLSPVDGFGSLAAVVIENPLRERSLDLVHEALGFVESGFGESRSGCRSPARGLVDAVLDAG